MSLDFCVLGSGSSGNSTVVRTASGAFLLDAGFGPRATDRRMHGIGLGVKDISAIVLTHLDTDHFNPSWLRTLMKFGIRVHLSRRRVKDFLNLAEVRDLEETLFSRPAGGEAGERSIRELLVPFDGELEPVPRVTLRALALAHDAEGSHGFVLEAGGVRAGFATDLGQVPAELIEAFRGVDFLAIESNYDPEMEQNSDRPFYLKQRVMGGSGHLSNGQALCAIREILDRTHAELGPERLPRHIVLLHRSRQCNCPQLVRRLFAGDPRIAPVLTLADQFERTVWLCARQAREPEARQLALAWA